MASAKSAALFNTISFGKAKSQTENQDSHEKMQTWPVRVDACSSSGAQAPGNES